MAYDSRKLAAIAYANGFTLWHYMSDDLGSDVDNAGYFNQASNMLQLGDFVFVNVGPENTKMFGVLVVVRKADGEIDMANLTAFATANAD